MTLSTPAYEAPAQKPSIAVVEADPNDEVAVRVEGISKRYRGPRGTPIDAVVDLSFTVNECEIFGILGPNGAGKTTTLEIIEGLRKPTSGQTYIFGYETRRDRRLVQELIGVQLQASSYFDYLNLEEILDLFGSFYPSALPPRQLLDAVGLADKRHALVRTLSSGQARRFSIVAALVNDPTVVFFDEPTGGLDPQSRRSLWEMIRRIRDDQAKTIVLTTHYMEEAHALCDRVLVIDNGHTKALDSPHALIEQHQDKTHIQFSADVDLADELRALPGVADVRVSSAGTYDYRLRVSAPEQSLSALFDLADRRRVRLRGLQVQPTTLEDVFLGLTGHSLRD